MNTTIGQEINMAQQEPTLYIPPNCKKLSELNDIPQIRLGIQGYGGTGKTFAALTFPNPVCANMDRGLGAHIGRADVIEVPFYNPGYCKSVYQNYGGFHDVKEVILTWLNKEAPKLTPNQTLVWDGNTGMQNIYHKWYAENKVISRGGVVNEFAEWQIKKSFYGEIMEIFKTLRCHVVFLAHEMDAKDKNGSYSGKIRPLLTGQFGDELMCHFTDWFRQMTSNKPTDFNNLDDANIKLWGMTKQEFRTMCESYPRNTIYYWQTEGDTIFDAKCSSLVNFPRYLPANYQSFLKYRRRTIS